MESLEFIGGDEVDITSDRIWYNYYRFLKYVFEMTESVRICSHQASSYSNSFHDVDRVHTHRNLHAVLHTVDGNDDVLHLNGVDVLHHVEWAGMAGMLRLSV